VTTNLSSLLPWRGDIGKYLYTRLDEDTTPDVMDSTGVVWRQRFREKSQMIFLKRDRWVGATALGKITQVIR